MRRPASTGFGDPQCETFDGLSFVCNFHCEANWASCGNWSVHAVAEHVPVGTNATIITKFAVRYDYETAVARLINTDVPESDGTCSASISPWTGKLLQMVRLACSSGSVHSAMW